MFIKVALLVFMLLNPFLLLVYLVDLVQEMDGITFRRVLCRAGIISAVVFMLFALAGDAIFTTILQARFASFQVFGGIIFLLIGIRFVFSGTAVFKSLRGNPSHVAGSIAMPIMIGPGTVSVSVVAGKQLGTPAGCSAILTAEVASILIVLLLKKLHDYVKPRSEALVERYIELAGRITALVVGTYSIEMIMQGITAWFALGNR